MSEAPTGIVALVFTDVQGSTPIWEREPAVMKVAIAQHHALLRTLIVRHGGYEVKTEGDAFMIGFADPGAAISWCLDAQATLLAADWPAALLAHPEAGEVLDAEGRLLFRGLRVRMGVHVGPVDAQEDPVSGRMDYYGPIVNRSARVMQAAHGGQVLASREAWAMAQGLASTESEDLGEIRMKGVSAAVALVQVHPADGPRRRFPPPRGEGGLRTNLTPSRTSFIGRSSEVDQVVAALRAGERLITLLGPGGAGKTRLARAAAAELGEGHPGGVWFVELAAARTADDVVEAVASVLTVLLPSDGTPERRTAVIGEALAARGAVLLVLDNLEQVTEPAREILGCWLDGAPSVRILATSQHRLSIAGEHLHEVGGLPEADAVALFAERARRVRPRFAAEGDDEGLVRDIVRSLEGQPLAIELAAARVGLLSLRTLRDRLGESLDVLASRPSDAPKRHAALRATIEWSWSLLAPWEQAAMSQLAQVPGGLDAEAAEAILDLGAVADAPPSLEVIQALVDKSMLRAWEPPQLAGETRLALYETVRTFAREHPADIAPRLVAWAAAHGETLLARWRANPRARLLRRLSIEVDNYRHALGIALATDVDAALRLYDTLDQALARDLGRASNRYRMVLDESLTDRLVAATASSSPSPHRRALLHRCQHRITRSDFEAAERDLSQLESNSGTDHRTLGLRADLAQKRSHLDVAWDLSTRAEEVVPVGDEEARFRCLHRSAWLALWGHTGESGAARQRVDEMVRLSSSLHAERPLALDTLALIEENELRLDAAITVMTEAQRLAVEQGQRDLADAVSGNIATALIWAGRLDEADDHLEAGLRVAEESGDAFASVRWHYLLGKVAYLRRSDEVARQQLTQAARMFNADPVSATHAELLLLTLDLVGGVPLGDRLSAVAVRAEAAGASLALRLRQLHAFLAAAAGDPDAVFAALANRGVVSRSARHVSEEKLALAFIDIVHARSSLASNRFADAVAARDEARGRLAATKPWDAELARLVERALADLEGEMAAAAQ